MKKINTKIGPIFTWYDYIKPRKDKSTQTVNYLQSSIKVDSYSQRYIGMHLSHTNKIYIAVAVNKKGDQGNWWRFILENRISTIIRKQNMTPTDKGVTMVPLPYKDLLYKDPWVYLNLYGPLEPTYLNMAFNEAQKQNASFVDRYNPSPRVRY
jgi:hypothetical protein